MLDAAQTVRKVEWIDAGPRTPVRNGRVTTRGSGRPDELRARATARADRPRRESSLADTLTLFEEVGFDDIRLVDIGQRGGGSKASVYRYSESEEAIFLELLAREIEARVREPELAPFRADYRHALLDTARLLLTALISEDAPASDVG